MILALNHPKPLKPSVPSRSKIGPGRVGTAAGAFALPNLMVSMAILLMVLAGITTSHLFGLRMFELTRAKLGASDEARAAISKLIEEIRSSKLVRIGNGNLMAFAEIPVNTPQRGSAIQVYPTLDTNQFIRYYWDAADRQLLRATNNAASASVVANSISNALVFSCEDFSGNILTNNKNNRVIGLNLQFYQLQYPTVRIGPGNYYDYYQLRTRITRRTLE